jgi:SAM-dependent methyltransferase
VKQLEKLDIDGHNLEQRQYFEQSVKATMVPRETRYLRRHVDEMLRFTGLLPGMHVLEVGCGMGRYTLLLAEMGVRVEGLDLSPFLLEKLSEFSGGRYDIPLHCCDIVNHPPEMDGKFDAVIGFFMLHHLHDITLSFKAMLPLVKPGGRIAFIEPNPYNLLYYVQMMITPGMTWRGDGGMVRMRPGVVLSAMRASGLGRLAMARFGFFPPFLANHPMGAKVETLLERVFIWRTFLPFQIFKGERV